MFPATLEKTPVSSAGCPVTFSAAGWRAVSVESPLAALKAGVPGEWAMPTADRWEMRPEA